MTTGRRFPFLSFEILNLTHGPAVDTFFTREMVEIAVRDANPEIWPRLNESVFETSI